MLRYLMAITAEEKEQVSRLRHQVHLQEGNISAGQFPSGTLHDEFDHLPTTEDYFILDAGRMVGSVRPLLANPEMEEKYGYHLGLPFGALFNLDALREVADQVAELARSTLLKEYRGQPVMVKLWNKAIGHARSLGVTHILAYSLLGIRDERTAFLLYEKFAGLDLSHPVIRTPARNPRDLASAERWRQGLRPEEIKATPIAPLMEIYLRLGAKITGAPVYCEFFRQYVIPIICDMTLPVNKVWERHILAKRKKRYVHCRRDERNPAIHHLTFGDPGKGCVINRTLLQELRETFEELKFASKREKGPAIVIFSPTPKIIDAAGTKKTIHSSRGADPSMFARAGEVVAKTELAETLRLGHEVVNSINLLSQGPPSPIIIIGISSGDLFGGALELFAGICDFILGTPSSHYALPEIGLGIIPALVGVNYFAKFIAPQRIKYLAYGLTISAEQAREWGLVLALYAEEELLPQAWALAAALSKKNSYVLGLNKTALSPSPPDNAESELLLESFYRALTQPESLARIERVLRVVEKKEKRIG